MATEPMPGETGENKPEQTFAQALQDAISEFTAGVSSLNGAKGRVSEAEDGEAMAQTQLESARETRAYTVNTLAETSQVAMAARDNLVSILQSWTP